MLRLIHTADWQLGKACSFDLGELAYQYPHERVIEGLTAQEALERLATEAVERSSMARCHRPIPIRLPMSCG